MVIYEADGSLPANQAVRVATAEGGRPKRALVLAAFATVYLIWGSTYLAIRYAIQTLPPFLMAGSRFIVAGAALALWARASGAARPTRAQLRSACVVGALLFLGGNGGVVWAEQYLPSGVAALVVATEPLWIVLLNWARRGGARPGRGVLVGLLLGFAGVWLLVESNASAGGAAGSRALLATVVVMGASVSWAVGSLYSVRATFPSSPLLSAGTQMLAGGALMIAAGTITGEWKSFDAAHVSALSAVALLYLIVCGSVVAFTAYSWLLRTVTPARASTYAYVNPLVAVLLGWALAGEELTTRTILAAVVITASVVVIVTRKFG
ncbi:MAG TPA: EamA family transporter [Pyrinomonadaceae bacterium]|jgi:drug/metabolite transporter (DMT)-like permease|nr:EamA family transporter [Pyrinomonadaceae bacterium]